MKNNVKSVVKDGLCTSCGVCAGSCPKKCISFNYGEERNIPIINEDKCVNCGICYDICPGKGISLKYIGDSLFSNQANDNQNVYCGHYLDAYTGHSNNQDIRYHSSSGGMVTSFLLYLLKKKIIDGAVVVRYKTNNPLCPEPFIATTEADILSSRGSKYIITSYDKVVNDILSFDGKLVVVGLPCQIQGLRKLAEWNKKLAHVIIGYFSIYCSLNKTKHSISYYLSHYKIKKEDVGYFSFRDDGCMGYMKYCDKNGHVLKRIPYVSFWYGSHSFFQNRRCTLCIDHFGDLSDISFGDINIPPYNEDKIGISSLVCRTQFWKDMLEECSREWVITLNRCPIEDVVKSQGFSKSFKKGKGVKSFLNFRSILGLKNPKYDVILDGSPSFMDYIAVIVKYLMFFIGHHKKLWNIIHVLDNSHRSVN